MEKLSATLLNNLAVASIVTGVLPPFSAALTAAAENATDWIIIAGSLVWLILSLLLHLSGRAWLDRRIQE